MSEKGAQIVEVTLGSPADQANLRVGDVVIAVEDKLVTEQMGLKEHILRYKPGDQVSLTILRNNRKQKVGVRLGVRPPDMMQQQPILPED
jgi:S1-C subfamily serine protease